MLIIEGPDCVGKTTLARRVIEHAVRLGLPACYQHFSRLPKSWVYPDSYQHYVSLFGVCDRFHMSEIAYVEARKDSRRLSAEGYRQIDTWCRNLWSYTAVITAKSGVITDRLRALSSPRNEMYDFETIERANDTYLDLVMGRHFGRDKELIIPDVDMHYHQDGVDDYVPEHMTITIAERWHHRLYQGGAFNV